MLPMIVGFAGTHLNQEEIRLFSQYQPAGYILFARNIIDADQVKALTAELKGISQTPSPYILIDQEGGRVQRLKPPNFPDWPKAAYFDSLYQHDKQASLKACYHSNYEMALLLKDLGINVNCTPVVDIAYANGHDVIGDRAYGNHWQQVADLACQVIDAHHAAGITPVIKHLPGHGLATADSHETLPIIPVKSHEQLMAQDFEAFRAICQRYKSHMNLFGMTAHLTYQSLDNANPATLSQTIIDQIIRKHIGFKGRLMTDDLNMKALNGTMEQLAAQALDAGCDLLLHCNGDLVEMEQLFTYCKRRQ